MIFLRYYRPLLPLRLLLFYHSEILYPSLLCQRATDIGKDNRETVGRDGTAPLMQMLLGVFISHYSYTQIYCPEKNIQMGLHDLQMQYK